MANYIDFGTFNFENVKITEVKSLYHGTGLYIQVVRPKDPEHFLGVMVERTGGADLVHIQRYQEFINISGTVRKNTKTEKTIFFVENAHEQIFRQVAGGLVEA